VRPQGGSTRACARRQAGWMTPCMVGKRCDVTAPRRRNRQDRPRRANGMRFHLDRGPWEIR